MHTDKLIQRFEMKPWNAITVIIVVLLFSATSLTAINIMRKARLAEMLESEAFMWEIQIKNIARDLPMLQGLSKEAVGKRAVLEFFGNGYVGHIPHVQAVTKAEKYENENHRLAMNMLKVKDGELHSQVAGVIDITSTDSGYLIEAPECTASVCKTPRVFVNRIH